MKTTFLVLMVLIGSGTIAQKLPEKNVPAPVKATFQKQYPNLTKVKWNKEGDNYEAEFETADKEISLQLDSSGTILETEVEIEVNALPKGVADYVKSNYKGLKIKEASKITDAKGGIKYEAEVKGKDLIFDSDGKFIVEKKN